MKKKKNNSRLSQIKSSQSKNHQFTHRSFGAALHFFVVLFLCLYNHQSTLMLEITALRLMLETISAPRCCRCYYHCCPHRCPQSHLCARNCDDDECAPPPPRRIERVLWDDDVHGTRGDHGGHGSHVFHGDVYAL